MDWAAPVLPRTCEVEEEDNTKAEKRGKVSAFMSFARLLARCFGVTTGVNPFKVPYNKQQAHNLHNFTINSLPSSLDRVDRDLTILRKSQVSTHPIPSLQHTLVYCKHVVSHGFDLVFSQVNIPKLTTPFLVQWYLRLHQLLGREGPQIHHRDACQWALPLGIQRIRLCRSCC